MKRADVYARPELLIVDCLEMRFVEDGGAVQLEGVSAGRDLDGRPDPLEN